MRRFPIQACGNSLLIFANTAGYVRVIRVDSVVQENGHKRYATFHTVRGGYNNIPADSNGACWVCNNVRAYSNGDWHFPNNAGDTLLLKTAAAVGDTWAFYTDTTSRWVEAKVMVTDTQTVGGVLDSVKTIMLTATLGTVPLPADPITGLQIVLSKANGFVQVPDLFLFPYRDLEAGYTPDPWYNKLNRSGFSPTESLLLFRQLRVDWNPGARQLFQAQAGNVFLNGQTRYSFYTPVAQSYYFDSVIARIDSPAFSEYAFSHWHWSGYLGKIKNGPPGRVVIRMDDEPFFYPRYMPEEYQKVGYNSLYIVEGDSSFCSSQPLYQEVRGDGWGLNVAHGYYPYPFNYKLGLGIVYNSRTGGDGDNWKDNLYSYRKGGIYCGRLNLGVPMLPLTDILKLYPQPATTQVFLEAPQLHYPATVFICNLQGQLLSRQQMLSAGKPLSVAGFPAGLYLISVTDAIGNSAVQKLLVGSN